MVQKPRKIKVFRGFSMPEQLTSLEEKLSGIIELTLAIRRSSGYGRLLQLVQKKSAPIIVTISCRTQKLNDENESTTGRMKSLQRCQMHLHSGMTFRKKGESLKSRQV